VVFKRKKQQKVGIMDKKYLKLYRNDGKFILAYNDDAYILHSIFGYKLLKEGKNDKCGFPSNILENILFSLEEKNISYEIYYKKSLEETKDFKKKNQYDMYFKEALLQVEVDKKVDLIKYKLSRLRLEEINHKLEEILDILK